MTTIPDLFQAVLEPCSPLCNGEKYPGMQAYRPVLYSGSGEWRMEALYASLISLYGGI